MQDIIYFYSPPPISPQIVPHLRKNSQSAFFRKFNKILPRTMQSYERIVEKHKNRLLSNNAGHYLLLIATTHFSPNSPTFEKKFAKSAFFLKFNKILRRTMQSYERIVEKHKNRLLSNNTGHYLLLIATTHFSPNSLTFENKFAKSAFFRKCMNACMHACICMHACMHAYACMHACIHAYIHTYMRFV